LLRVSAKPDETTQFSFAPAGGLGHALIIEDDPLIAASIEDELGQLGFSSFGVARSEREAVMFAAGRPPQFITVDAKLEQGNGIQALIEICQTRAVPSIVVTGTPFEVLLPGVVTLGKPFNRAAFRVAYEQAITRPFRAAELSAA
jgi:CheY-like chemotaxis protein